MASLGRLPAEPFVPQDPPMCLLDTLLTYGDNTMTCEAVVKPDNPFLCGDGLPAFVGLEIMAQAIAAYGGYRESLKGKPPKVGFLLGSRKVTLYRDMLPIGEPIHVRAEETWGDHEFLRFHCVLALGDQPVIEAGINVFQPEDLEAFLAKRRLQDSKGALP